MRIIPKRTKVRMELFKGIELVDVLVAGAGMGISASFLVSNLPGNLVLSVIALLSTVGLVVPIEDDKGYILLFNVLKYLGRYRVFYKRSALQEKKEQAQEQAEEQAAGRKKKLSLGSGKRKGPAGLPGISLEDITPFTGIDGNYIVYGSSYSAVVMSIPSVEFRFYSENRQNSVIDRCLGAILRTSAADEVISMVKLDRPVIYDEFIESERKKLDDLKEAYLN